ncbi:hypothetical protein B296_00028991 [Ensete ventricosum]|uniref:Uncharacterized protein n=1 Tax=Ensete ventricosum TaxID=4639 RepID=A0A426XW15_ENSVE|nr:hypothetical protein B296_00028991 [Ensete ventricosum]
MLFNSLIGLSTPMDDSLGSDSRNDNWQRFVKPLQYKNTKQGLSFYLTNLRIDPRNNFYILLSRPKARDPMRSKGATTVHSYGGVFLRMYLGKTIESRGTKDKGHSLTSHAEAYYPLYCHPCSCTKKLTRDELREQSTKELCLHYDESLSHEHLCKKGRRLVIEPTEDEDIETSEEALEPKEEAMEEESQSADYVVHALAGYSNLHMMKVGGLLK